MKLLAELKLRPMAAVTPAALAQVARRFEAFREAAGFGVIRSEADYQRAMALIDAILDATRGDPAREDAAHLLAALLDFLSEAVHDYETVQHPIPNVPPREVLRFLMEQHGLTQSDLPEVGNQSVVSQILSGRRQLNARQIAALVARFGIAAEAFLEPASERAA